MTRQRRSALPLPPAAFPLPPLHIDLFLKERQDDCAEEMAQAVAEEKEGESQQDRAQRVAAARVAIKTSFKATAAKKNLSKLGRKA